MNKAFTMIPQDKMNDFIEIINSCRNTIDGIMELHKNLNGFCRLCGVEYPCQTMQVVIDNA